jgi:ribosomal protein S18 acetylase RimI-like enzyme
MIIRKATLNDLDSISKLFDLYRIFYKQESNLEGARMFLKDRMSSGESVIFIAFDEEIPVGFTQLYPLFSSVNMHRTWLLNDLYVKENIRGKGFGEGLLKKVIAFAEETGAKGVSLETGKDNFNAQRLYEKVGFERETDYFYHYSI